MNSKKQIDILYITDDAFAMPTGVSIYSLKKHRNNQYVYNIHILLDCVSDRNQEKLKQMQCEGFNIFNYSTKSDYYSSIEKKCKLYGGKFHVSRSALLKFNIADIVPELNRVLYIDGDTIIRDDLVDFFFCDMEGKIIAAIKDMSDVYFSNISEYGKQIGLEISDYFNSGVMLIDLKLYKEKDIKTKLIRYRDEGCNVYMDQDAFNAVLANEKKVLPNKYNFLAFELLKGFYKDISPNILEKDLYDGMYDCLSSQSIIHFASFMKPWRYHIPGYSDLFYEYYKESTFGSENLEIPSMMDILVFYMKMSSNQDRKSPLFGNIRKGEKIILYGAGKVGRAIHDEICIKRYCTIVLWVDKEKYKNSGQISSPERINETYLDIVDHILIAVSDKNSASEIKMKLQKMGADKTKIIWYLE